MFKSIISARPLLTNSRITKFLSSAKLKSLIHFKDYLLEKIFNDKHLIQKEILRHNKLFHHLNKSPVDQLIKNAKRIEELGACSYCLKLAKQKLLNSSSEEKTTSDQADEIIDQKLYKNEKIEGVKSPVYYCKECGFPTHCCEEHHKLDTEHKEVVCDELYTRNLDEHDLRSKRDFPEFEYPMKQQEDSSINFLDWNNFFYTRKFQHVDELHSMRHVASDLTYPVTIASMLYESPPLRFYKSLTYEGKKSLSALRYTIEKSMQTEVVNRIRVFVLSPYYASRIPQEVYQEINYILPGVSFKIYFIGEDVNTKYIYKKEDTEIKHKYITRDMRLEYVGKNFMQCYNDYVPFDPYRDLFIIFNPQIKISNATHQWEETIKIMLKTKCMVVITSANINDLKRDVDFIESKFSLVKDMDFLLRPIENKFRDLKLKPNIKDLKKLIYHNNYIYSIRGKKHEVIKGFKLPLFLKE